MMCVARWTITGARLSIWGDESVLLPDVLDCERNVRFDVFFLALAARIAGTELDRFRRRRAS